MGILDKFKKVKNQNKKFKEGLDKWYEKHQGDSIFYDAFPKELINDLQEVLKVIHVKTSNNVVGYSENVYQYKLNENLINIPEYVIEILGTIYEKLKDRNNDDIKKFCLNNKETIQKSYSRMGSYWNEYYRTKEYNFHKYFGRKLFRECLGYSRIFEYK